jgi:xylulose-5-phosphate/fructose-6-phosphate phosphoketolase
VEFRDYAVDVPAPGIRGVGDTRVLAPFLRDVVKSNEEERNFRIFGPDETISNGLGAVFETTQRQWDAATVPNDEFLAPSGRVVDSMLSEHQCQGWLEGYLLTGRHGLFNCYEAFIHIIDSMFNQHAKWLTVTSHLPWRRKIASLNYLLASHVWRQDHNGFTHQDPGFIDHVVNKKAAVVRVYFPPDANCLLSVMDHCCLRSRHYVNVVVAGKHPAPQWLTMDAAVDHCTQGIGIWQWASNDQGAQPDVVMACCGDVPTLETLAAVSILRAHLPELRIRVVNVIDLMKLQPPREHPAGHLRLPCLPVVDPSAHLPAHQPPQHPRPRLQGRGHHHHALRHDRAQRPGSLPPRDGHHRSIAADRRKRRSPEGGAREQVAGAQEVHREMGRGPAGDPQLAVECYIRAAIYEQP